MDFSDPQATSFANRVLSDWESAMDRFFGAVERKKLALQLTDKQVRKALSVGYGDDVADAWDDWTDGD